MLPIILPTACTVSFTAPLPPEGARRACLVLRALCSHEICRGSFSPPLRTPLPCAYPIRSTLPHACPRFASALGCRTLHSRGVLVPAPSRRQLHENNTYDAQARRFLGRHCGLPMGPQPSATGIPSLATRLGGPSREPHTPITAARNAAAEAAGVAACRVDPRLVNPAKKGDKPQVQAATPTFVKSADGTA